MKDNRKDWDRHFEFFRTVAEEAQKQGLQFAYHNHAFEFEVKVRDRFVFDALYDALTPSLAKVEMDLGWVQFAGQDPLSYIAKYQGRLPLLHLKDFRVAADGIRSSLGMVSSNCAKSFKQLPMPVSNGLSSSRTNVKSHRSTVSIQVCSGCARII
jgi:sugar phosphate isomerase/epimerase